MDVEMSYFQMKLFRMMTNNYQLYIIMYESSMMRHHTNSSDLLFLTNLDSSIELRINLIAI